MRYPSEPMPDSHTLVHISDTHFGTQQTQVVEALVARINQIHPDVLIWSGDVTQRARAGQFRSARRFLSRLQYKHLLCVPGNHDVPLYNILMRFTAPFRNYRRHMKLALQSDLELGSAFIIGLNTCNPWHYKNGRITQQQIDSVERKLLAQPKSKLKMLVCHHPFDVIHDHDQENIVKHAAPALQCWAQAGLDLVLGGHIHHQFSRSLLHRYPDLPRDVHSCQAGTAFSYRVRGGLPNSFMQLTTFANKADTHIQQWDYIESQNAFSRTGEFFPCRASTTTRKDSTRFDVAIEKQAVR